MAVVDEHHSVVLLGEFGNLVQRCNVTIHTEHAIGDDQFPLATRVLLQDLFERSHVVMLVHRPRCLGQSDSVDDGTVVQLI